MTFYSFPLFCVSCPNLTLPVQVARLGHFNNHTQISHIHVFPHIHFYLTYSKHIDHMKCWNVKCFVYYSVMLLNWSPALLGLWDTFIDHKCYMVYAWSPMTWQWQVSKPTTSTWKWHGLRSYLCDPQHEEMAYSLANHFTTLCMLFMVQTVCFNV